MSAGLAFFLGIVVGLVVSLIVLALAKASGTPTPWEREDAARQEATAKREQIREEESRNHDAVATITPGEMDLIVAGSVTLRDVLRGRNDPSSPFFRAKPSEPTGPETPGVEPASGAVTPK